MKKILAPMTALSIALGASAFAAIPAHAEEEDDINFAIEAPAPSLKDGLTCASTPADILLPASPTFSPAAGVTDAPLEYLTPVRTEAGFKVVVNVLPKFQRYYDVWGNGLQVRAETVTFIIPACPPVVEVPPAVEPVIPAPVVPAPPVADPVVVAPPAVTTPVVTPAAPVPAPPAVQPQAPVEVASVPVAETAPIAAEVPAKELASTGAKEDLAVIGALALFAGLALLVLLRKLA